MKKGPVRASILLALFIVVFTSCNNDASRTGDVKLKTVDTSKSILNELIISDVPKFIAVLPSLPHNNLEAAFESVNKVLGYNTSSIRPNEHTFEAWTKIAYGKSITDGQLNLLAVRLAQSSEFQITLFAFPRPTDDIILRTAEPLLKGYKEIEIENLSPEKAWEVNGWLLIVQKHGLSFSPKSLMSQSDSRKK